MEVIRATRECPILLFLICAVAGTIPPSDTDTVAPLYSTAAPTSSESSATAVILNSSATPTDNHGERHSGLPIAPVNLNPNVNEVHNKNGNSIPELNLSENIADDSVKIHYPALFDPLYRGNVQYEENSMNELNKDLEAIEDTINMQEMNIEPQSDESDAKNLGHLINLLEEIKRRIDLFKKDVSEILGPLQLNGGHRRFHHHRHQFTSERPQPDAELLVEKPKPPSKSELPAGPETPIEEKPEAPAKVEVPANPAIPTKTETPLKTPEKEPTQTQTPSKPENPEEKPIKSEIEPTQTEKPGMPEEKPLKSEIPEKPVPTETEPGSSASNVRSRRSPYRGFGGPYGGGFLGEPLFGYGSGYGGLYGSTFNYGGYGSGYPYYNYDEGFRPLRPGGLII